MKLLGYVLIIIGIVGWKSYWFAGTGMAFAISAMIFILGVSAIITEEG